MRIDMHCHAVGSGRELSNVDNDVYFNPEDNQLLFTRLLGALVESELVKLGADVDKDGKINTAEYFELLYRMLATSEEIDGLTLLALDAVYSSKTHELDARRTNLWVSNRWLSTKVEELNRRLDGDPNLQGKKKRFFFGASVSPYRKDWESELAYVLTQTSAVLMKWIPSTQHIRLQDADLKPFYRMLASYNLPLLCHIGPEYSFPEGIRNKALDDFHRLETALECGATVIGAHCCAPVFPFYDPNVMKEYRAFMRDANSGGRIRLWSDTSGLCLATRLPLIPEILDAFPPEWLVHGSDFPIPIDSWPLMPHVTTDIAASEYAILRKTRNPLDLDVRIKRAHGFKESILTNSGNALRLPAPS